MTSVSEELESGQEEDVDDTGRVVARFEEVPEDVVEVKNNVWTDGNDSEDDKGEQARTKKAKQREVEVAHSLICSSVMAIGISLVNNL